MAGPEYVYAWRYEVAAADQPAFETLYGPDGDWVRLFRRSPDWLGTELLADRRRPGTYVTIDRWSSRSAYEAFRTSVAGEWAAIDRRGERLTRREEEIGTFRPA